MARACCSSFGQKYGQAASFCYKDTRTCATCWTALWHLDALCYEGREDMGQQMGYRSLEWNRPKETMNSPIWAGIVDGAKLF